MGSDAAAEATPSTLKKAKSGDSKQSEVRKLGMGSTIVLERDESEFARLIQLGDVLGLTEMDTMQIHQSLAEQAFKNQAQQMVSGSTMTEEKKAALKDLQTKLGLQDSVADSVIKGLVDKNVVGNLQALHAQGLLSVAKLREMKASGIDIDSVMKKEARETLYKKEVEKMLSNGQGVFEQQEVLESIPGELLFEAGERLGAPLDDEQRDRVPQGRA